MTSRPRLRRGGRLWPGLAAAALFVVLAVTFANATFGDPAGLGGVESITATIGHAMFDLPSEAVESTGTEPFLVPFEIVDVVLVAALAAAVMLARREVDGEVVSALVTREEEEEGGDED